MSEQEKPVIDDKCFYCKLDGMRAVILFPALTTPCLVSSEDPLNILIAVNSKDIKNLQQLEKGNKDSTFEPQEKVSVKTALKLHAQLLLTSWGEAHKQHIKHKKDHTHHVDAINSWSNTLYGTPDKVIEAFDKEDFIVHYVQELPKMWLPNSNLLVNMYDGTSGFVPFGVLAGKSVEMYIDAGFTHFFQLQCKNCFGGSSIRGKEKKMYELIWVHAPLPPEHNLHSYECASDTLFLRNFEKKTNTTGSNELLKPNVNTEKQQIIIDKGQDAPNLKQEDLNLYRLLALSAKADASLNTNTSVENSAYLTQQGGSLLYSYHPVYYSDEDFNRIGCLSDLHLSSRQTTYKMSRAQVIPGAPLGNSPYIGRVAHEYIDSAKWLMKNMNEDVMLVAGDIYDHIRNLKPEQCMKELMDIKKEGRAAKIWEYMDYGKIKEKDPLYPKHIDGLMMLELILDYYSRGKPLFFVSGNHEGYREPYGIYPLFLNTVKTNDGIPADHNLTIYEAALLYGDSYGGFEKICNFSGQAMQWIYQTFSPWADFVVQHKSLNFIGLGWGPNESFLFASMGAGGNKKDSSEGWSSLPRANEALSIHQWKLVERVTKDASAAKKAVNTAHSAHVETKLQEKRLADAEEQARKKKETARSNYTASVARQAELEPNAHENFANMKLLWLKQTAAELEVAQNEHQSAKKRLEEAKQEVKIKQEQIATAEKAKESSAIKTNLLFSHFTHINYDGAIPLNQQVETAQKITQTLWTAASDLANTGSHTEYQQKMWGVLGAGTIHYTFSGHSHRSGVYTWGDRTDGFMSDTLHTTSLVAPSSSESGKTPGMITYLDEVALPKGSGAFSLVSPSAGPFSVQNMQGEFANLGLEKPGGLVLDLKQNQVKFYYWEGSKPSYEPVQIVPKPGVVEETVDFTKPRLAVLASYLADIGEIDPFIRIEEHIEITEEYFEEPLVFSFGHMKINTISHNVTVTSNPAFEDIFGNPNTPGQNRGCNPIGEVRLHLFNNNKMPRYLDTVSILLTRATNTHELVGKIEGGKMKELKNFSPHYASLHFHIENASAEVRSFLTRYDTSSPWCLPVTVHQMGEDMYINFNFRSFPSFKKLGEQFLEFATKKK